MNAILKNLSRPNWEIHMDRENDVKRHQIRPG